MRRIASAIVCLLLLAPAALADLAGDVDAALRGRPKGSSVAVQLLALGDRGPRHLYARDAATPMIPASNLKLLTTAAAQAGLGDDFKFRTRLFLKPSGDGAAEVGVVGDGDPAFGDATLLRRLTGPDGWGTTTVFERWADALRNSGVTRVTTLRLDDSIFDEERDHPNWPPEQKHRWYEAQVSGLNLNVNCVDLHLTRGGGSRMRLRLDPPTEYVTVVGDVRVGKKNAVRLARTPGTNDVPIGGETDAREQRTEVTVDGPTLYFGTVLAETLGRAGITVESVEIDRGLAERLSDGWQLAAVHETPMATVLSRTNKDSINLYAECLFRRLGHAVTGAPGSREAGAAAVLAYLGEAGIDPSGIALDDGSGMSRHSRVTAAALAGALAERFASDDFDAYRDALSVVGSDGTLARRFRDADRRDLHGRVFAKSGYINGVSTLSGYLQGRDGAWYAFSVLVNDSSRGEIWKAHRLQENVVLALDRSLVGTVRQ